MHVGGPPEPELRNSDLYEPTEAHVGWFAVIGVNLPLDMLYRFHMEGIHHRFHKV